MQFLYNLFIRFYSIAIFFASFSSQKAKQWIIGRVGWKENIPESIKNCIWIHASSLGEFEQGRPVIEAIKSQFPKQKILLTFFSPSGYEIRKDYEFADHIMYLPLDTTKNAQDFVRIIKPKVAIFIKYEYWFNLIKELNNNNIPIYLVSAIFRSNQHFFQTYGFWFQKRLKMVSHFFVQDKASLNLLKTIQIKNATISGDTRFDRVVQITQNVQKFAAVESFKSDKLCMIAGSTWEPDEKLLLDFMNNIKFDCKLIIAPHQIDENHLTSIEKHFAKFKPIRLSAFESENTNHESRVLIVDSIGKLMHLYQYCDFAYIGGGFGSGIHNILEAATFGKPVFFGPNYHKFNEAKELIELGGAFSLGEYEELQSLIHKLYENKNFYSRCSIHSSTYIENNKGATEIIVKHLSKHLV